MVGYGYVKELYQDRSESRCDNYAYYKERQGRWGLYQIVFAQSYLALW